MLKKSIVMNVSLVLMACLLLHLSVPANPDPPPEAEDERGIMLVIAVIALVVTAAGVGYQIGKGESGAEMVGIYLFIRADEDSDWDDDSSNEPFGAAEDDVSESGWDCGSDVEIWGRTDDQGTQFLKQHNGTFDLGHVPGEVCRAYGSWTHRWRGKSFYSNSEDHSLSRSDKAGDSTLIYVDVNIDTLRVDDLLGAADELFSDTLYFSCSTSVLPYPLIEFGFIVQRIQDTLSIMNTWGPLSGDDIAIDQLNRTIEIINWTHRDSFWVQIVARDSSETFELSGHLDHSVGKICASCCPCDTCFIPIRPGSLPFWDTNQSTCGRVNDYENTCLGDFDGSEEIIYELDVDSTVYVNIIVDPKGSAGTGIAIDDNCPPDATCIATATDTTGTPYCIYLQLDPGTYTIMVDSRQDLPCIPDFDLCITRHRVIDAIGPDHGLTFAWFQDAQMMEEVKWYYSYLPDGAESATVESHTGELDFRVKHPEHDGKRIYFIFFAPPGQNGWRQLILSLSSGGKSDVFTIGDYPGEWHIPDIAAILGSACGDTIFTAVDMNLYGASNPGGFGDLGASVGKNLSGLGVTIVDGQVEGLEGIYWATSEWTLDTTGGRSIFKPIGGVGTLLNSADCPDDLEVVAEHVGGIQDDGTVCCTGARGNVDGDAGENVNVADLTYLVNYLFAGGSPPPCWEEADLNSDGSVNVADLTYLVDYLFVGGPAPLPCP